MDHLPGFRSYLYLGCRDTASALGWTSSESSSIEGCKLVFPPTWTEVGPSPLGERLWLAGPFPFNCENTACGPSDGTYQYDSGGSSPEGISLEEEV